MYLGHSFIVVGEACQEEHKEEAVSMVIDLGAESSGNQELDCSLQKLTPNALLPTS